MTTDGAGPRLSAAEATAPFMHAPSRRSDRGIEQFRRVDATYRLALGHEGALKRSLASPIAPEPLGTRLRQCRLTARSCECRLLRLCGIVTGGDLNGSPPDVSGRLGSQPRSTISQRHTPVIEIAVGIGVRRFRLGPANRGPDCRIRWPEVLCSPAAGKRHLAVIRGRVELLVAESTNRCRPGRGTETRCL